jgi:transcription elongation factor Elf1
MSPHDDNEEPELDCPVCGHSFHTFARLDHHLAEHEGLKRCKTCGETIHGAFHRCR